MKKYLVCMLIAVMVFSSCGKNDSKVPDSDTSISDTSVPSDTPVSESAATESHKVLSDKVEQDKLSVPVSEKSKKDTKMTEFVTVKNYKSDKQYKTQENSIIIIDFDGTIDGKPVAGMSAKDYSLTLGSGKFINGFEDKLIGHYEGDTVEFDLKFPDPYTNNEELSGKEAHWVVKIKEYQNEGYFALLDIEKEAEFKSYPKDDYEDVSNYIIDYYKDIAENSYGIELGEFVDAYQLDLTDLADSNLKDLVVCEAILEAENLDEFSDAYQGALKKLLTANEVTSIEEAVSKGIPETWIRLTTTRRVAYDVIMENAKTKQEEKKTDSSVSEQNDTKDSSTVEKNN